MDTAKRIILFLCIGVLCLSSHTNATDSDGVKVSHSFEESHAHVQEEGRKHEQAGERDKTTFP